MRSGRELRLLSHALAHPERPVWLWPAVIAIGFYALEPFNFAIPWLGAVDDLVLLPLLLHALVLLLPAKIRSSFAERSPP
jgi:uncharacterized membrane protein YkvA (DUF1232 family)